MQIRPLQPFHLESLMELCAVGSDGANTLTFNLVDGIVVIIMDAGAGGAAEAYMSLAEFKVLLRSLNAKFAQLDNPVLGLDPEN